MKTNAGEKAPLATPATAADSSDTSHAYRAYVLLLLFLVAIINMMDRMIVPALAEPLKAHFDLNDSQFGFVAGFAYSFSYIICGIPLGLMVDRVNRARLLSGLVGFWGVACMMMGAVNSYFGLIVARVVVAGAESGGNPTCISLISDYFPPQKRATAIGIFFSAHGIATFMVFSLAGWIAAAHDWRTAFMVVGLPGLVLGIVLFCTLREPPKGAFDKRPANPVERAEKPSAKRIVGMMVANPTIRYVTLAAVCCSTGFAGITAFSASFFYRVHGLSLAEAGIVTGLVLGVGSSLGSVLGGFACDRATKHAVNGPCYIVALGLLLATPFVAMGVLASGLYLSVALIFVSKLLVGAYFGATFSTVTRAAPTEMRGAVVAFLNVFMNLVGASAGPQLAGLMSDAFASAGYPDPLRLSLLALTPLFVLASLFYLLTARAMKAAAAKGAIN